MKRTGDIVKALNTCIEEGYESVTDFARLTNISARTLSKYLRRETQNIKNETWGKLHPLLKPYLRAPSSSDVHKRPPELTADEKVLLDAFSELPSDLRNQKLFEIIELAKKEIQKSRKNSSR